MSRNYYFKDQQQPHFISFATVYWLDVFTRPKYKDILVDSMNYCVNDKGLIIYAWIIMTNHVHMIIGTRGDKMENILRDLKKYSAKQIISSIKDNIQESRREWMLWVFQQAGKKNSNNPKNQFWQQHNKPIILDNNKIIDQKLDYIHNNPVVEEIVFEPFHYKYSSAVDYAGDKGLVKIELIQ